MMIPWVGMVAIPYFVLVYPPISSDFRSDVLQEADGTAATMDHHHWHQVRAAECRLLLDAVWVIERETSELLDREKKVDENKELQSHSSFEIIASNYSHNITRIVSWATWVIFLVWKGYTHLAIKYLVGKRDKPPSARSYVSAQTSHAISICPTHYNNCFSALCLSVPFHAANVYTKHIKLMRVTFLFHSPGVFSASLYSTCRVCYR